jgi:putative SOS response-associated peptidase YedK
MAVADFIAKPAPSLRQRIPWRLLAKIAGHSRETTRNVPAIANVRAQEVSRKKNFMKIWRM